MDTTTDGLTVKDVLARIDEAWAGFSGAVRALPSESLEERLGEESWTRKQMLAHISTWHDLTVDRLAEFAETGKPSKLDEDDDVINARAAHASEGRTTGEILLTMEDSFRRLRREIARLSNAQLAAHDGWAASVIAGNTFGHYEDHLADLRVRSA
jgi:hypothetical protein